MDESRSDRPGQRTLLVAPRGCIDPANGGGQRTHLFLEALQRLGPVTVAIEGRPPAPRTRAMLPPEVDLIPLGNPPRGFPGSGRLRRWRRRHKLYHYLQDYERNPRARQRLGELVAERGIDAIVFRYFTSYFACVGPDDAELQRLSFVDLDDRDDVMAERAWSTTFGRAGRLIYATVIRRIIDRRMRELGGARAYFTVVDGDGLRHLAPPAIYVPNTVLNVPDPATLEQPSAQKDILFVGGYGHYPNPPAVAWFLRHCWPEIHRRHPDCRFRVVGYGPWQRMVAAFPDAEGAEFAGFAADLAPVYHACRLVVAPLLQGGGTSIKVVEAAAHGRPVVATPVAARGLAPGFVEALAVAAEPAAFTAACLALLADDRLADAQGSGLLAVQRRFYAREPIVASIADSVGQVRFAAAPPGAPPVGQGGAARGRRPLFGRRRFMRAPSPRRFRGGGWARRCYQAVVRAVKRTA